METNLQGYRTYFQSPFYSMVSSHGQNPSSMRNRPYGSDPCCTVPTYLPHHAVGNRPYDIPCVYHSGTYVDPQFPLAVFQGKNISLGLVFALYFHPKIPNFFFSAMFTSRCGRHSSFPRTSLSKIATKIFLSLL